MEYYLAMKKELIWVSPNEMLNLARTYCKEWSKREKDKYFILMHVYGIQKDDTDEPISRVAMEMQT